MVEARRIRRFAGALTMVTLPIALPACHTPGGSPPPVVRDSDGTTSRFSLRPILNGEGYRPYYVAGYAGASYGPGAFSSRSTVARPVAQPAGVPAVTVDQGTWNAD